VNPVALPLASNFGMARASVAAGGSLINLYPQTTPTGARGPVALIGSPGTSLFVQLQYENALDVLTDETVIHGMIQAWDGKVVVVGTHAFYLVDSDGSYEVLEDDELSIDGPVSLAWNRSEVAVVDGETGWWVTESAVTEIDDEAFYPSNAVTFLDSYLIFNRAGTGQAFATGSYSDEFNALDFAEAEKAPDDLVGVLAAGDNLFMLGEKTTEVWYNAANANGLVFSRIQGGTMEHGCASYASAQEDDGTVLWLTDGGLVVMASNLSLQRVSDDQVEIALKERRAHWATARAFIYRDEGHTFYVLTVGDITLAFDLSTQSWHQRANYSRGSVLVRAYVDAWGKHIVGDDSGRLLVMSSEVFEDAGEPLIAEVVSMPIVNSRVYAALGSLEIEIDTGEFAAGHDYGVGLSTTKTGGKSWSTERRASLGPSGVYGQRVEWRKLGAKREHRFRLRISDPIKRKLLAQSHVRMA
jgi:hypothetical protein